MKYVQLAIVTMVLMCYGYRPAVAADEGKNDARNPEHNSQLSGMPGKHDPLIFAQNPPNAPNDEEITDQFLDSYYRDVPIPRSTDPWSRVRLMIMWQMVDYLDIDEDTAKDFFPIYSEYQRNRNELMEEQRRLTASITASVDDETADVDALKISAERLIEIESEMVDLKRAFLADSEDRLTSRQYVKLIVFDERMKNELLRRILPDGRNRGGFQGDGQDRNQDDNRGSRGGPGR